MSYSFSSDIKKKYYSIHAKSDSISIGADRPPTPRSVSELAMQCLKYQYSTNDNIYVNSSGKQRVSISPSGVSTTFITEFDRWYYVGDEDIGEDATLYVEDTDLNDTAEGKERAFIFEHGTSGSVLTIQDNDSEENTLCSLSPGNIAVVYKIDDNSWDAYVIKGSGGQFSYFEKIGACEENPVISANFDTMKDSEGNEIVKTESVEFSFVDMNVSKANYDALRALDRGFTIAYVGEFNEDSDTFETGELLIGVQTNILPDIGEDFKVSFKGSQSGSDLDNFYKTY